MRDANGHSVVPPSVDLTITTDASKTGWGATNQKLSTRGVWTREENQAHINLLEMKAVLLALKSLVSSQRNIHIQLFIDNSTTIAYLNLRGQRPCQTRLWRFGCGALKEVYPFTQSIFLEFTTW